MVQIDVVRANWSGLQGGAGVSTFYSIGEGGPNLAPVHDFFAAVAGGIPSRISISIPNSGDSIDVTTGALVGSWNSTAVGTVAGGGPGAYASPVGVVVEWGTALIANRRRLKGKTFLVPVIGSTFDSDGTPIADRLETIRAAAALFAATPAQRYGIYRRPHTKTVKDPRESYAGQFSQITSSTVPDNAAILRGRRD